MGAVTVRTSPDIFIMERTAAWDYLTVPGGAYPPIPSHVLPMTVDISGFQSTKTSLQRAMPQDLTVTTYRSVRDAGDVTGSDWQACLGFFAKATYPTQKESQLVLAVWAQHLRISFALSPIR